MQARQSMWTKVEVPPPPHFFGKYLKRYINIVILYFLNREKDILYQKKGKTILSLSPILIYYYFTFILNLATPSFSNTYDVCIYNNNHSILRIHRCHTKVHNYPQSNSVRHTPIQKINDIYCYNPMFHTKNNLVIILMHIYIMIINVLFLLL